MVFFLLAMTTLALNGFCGHAIRLRFGCRDIFNERSRARSDCASLYPPRREDVDEKRKGTPYFRLACNIVNCSIVFSATLAYVWRHIIQIHVHESRLSFIIADCVYVCCVVGSGRFVAKYHTFDATMATSSTNVAAPTLCHSAANISAMPKLPRIFLGKYMRSSRM